MIAILDYGMGNLKSVLNLCARAGAPAKIASRPEALAGATHLILPGVGNFAKGIENVRNAGFVPAIEKSLAGGAKLLGICLGMQLLGESSEEGDAKGLGLVKGRVVRFSFADESLRIPHVGFNSLEWDDARKNEPLFRHLPADARFYFTHSYHFAADDTADGIGTTEYGKRFPSVVRRGNVMGTQFHPEKSHHFGLALLRGFLEV